MSSLQHFKLTRLNKICYLLFVAVLINIIDMIGERETEELFSEPFHYLLTCRTRLIMINGVETSV